VVQSFEDAGFAEDHTLSNLKLFLGALACAFALIAQVLPCFSICPCFIRSPSFAPPSLAPGPLPSLSRHCCSLLSARLAALVCLPSRPSATRRHHQFYPSPLAPLPFPESRPLLLVCCVLYFFLSFTLQLITSFYEQVPLSQPAPAQHACVQHTCVSVSMMRR